MKIKCFSFSLIITYSSFIFLIIKCHNNDNSSNSIVEFDLNFNRFDISFGSLTLIPHDNLTNVYPTFEFCIGSSKQCFQLAIDNTIYQTWIPGERLSKYFNRTYKESKEDKIVKIDLKSTSVLENHFIAGNFVKIETFPYKTESLFFLSLMNETNVGHHIGYMDGKMGILRASPVTENFLETISYVDYLYANKIISQPKFSVEMNSELTKGKLVFGKLEEDEKVKNYCELSKTRYRLSWSCSLTNVIYANYSIEVKGEKNGEFVSFETLSQNIFAPYESGDFIIQKMQEASDKECSIKKSGRNEYLVCNTNVNIDNFEKIILKSKGGFEFMIYPEDIFEYDEKDKRYISRLVVMGNESNLWVIGLPGFKGKRIAFNQEKERIEIFDRKKSNKYNKILNNYYVWFGIGFVCLSVILIALFCIRRKRLRTKNEVNFTLLH